MVTVTRPLASEIPKPVFVLAFIIAVVEVKSTTPVPLAAANRLEAENITAMAKPKVRFQTQKHLFPLANNFPAGVVQLFFNMADTMSCAMKLCHGV